MLQGFRPPPQSPLAFAQLALCCAVLCTQAAAAAPEADGYEIRREGTSPFVRDAAMRTAVAREAQCNALAAQCRVLATTHGSAAGAACLARMQSFELIGDPGTAGRREVIEYHLPARQKSSVTVRTLELVETAVCRLEVLERVTTTITHHQPRGRRVFTRVINPRKGAQPWRSQHLPALGADSLALVSERFAIDATMVVSPLPERGEERFAGMPCHWKRITGPWTMALCESTHSLGMPINRSLSTQVTGPGADGPEVLLEEKVVLFRGPVALSTTHFEPGGHRTDEASHEPAAEEDGNAHAD